MKEAKFTPGLWCLKPEEHNRDYIRIRGTIPGTRMKIANVCGTVHHGNEGWQDRDAEEVRANARLIAAAPELFSALATAVERQGFSDAELIEARRILAQVTDSTA